MSNHSDRSRATLAVAVVGVLGMALSACTGATPTAAPDDAVDGSTIEIGTFSPLVPQYQVWADAYMKEFPDRTVKIVGVSEDFAKYQQTLATQRISDSLPDIFFNVDFAANDFANNDVPLDLAPFLAEGKDGLGEELFLPQFLGQYRPLDDPEAIMGLPVSADSTALVWNKTLFDEAGVTEYPTPDWTWDDFLRVAEEIQTKTGGKVYGAVPPAGDGSLSVVFGPVLNAAGVKVYDPETNTTDIGSDDAIAVWEKMLAFYGDASAPYTVTQGDPGYDFTSGKVAMGITSRANIAGFRDALAEYEWDVEQIPTVDGKHPSGGGSYAFSIAETSKNVNAAWAFLAWFYEQDGGLKVAQTPEGGGIIPPTLTGLEEGTWKDVEIPANIGVFAQTAKDASLTVQMPGATGTALTDAVKQAFQEVLLNGESVETAFTKAQDTVNSALQEQD